MYVCVRGIKPGKGVVMYVCVRGIDITSFYDISYLIFDLF
jgi:hypothetical protein